MKMSTFAIVPAAGRSQRMGRPKLLLPWGSGTVIEKVLEAWRESAANHVLAVVHPEDHALAEMCRRCGAITLVPPTPPPEMKDSVVVALHHIRDHLKPAPADAWLLAPADMPELSANAINVLIAAHDPRHPRILAAVYGQRRGHPVLFPWPLAEKVFHLPPDTGVNQLLAEHEVVEVPCAEGEPPADMDTPEHYRRMMGQSGSNQLVSLCPPPID